MATLAEHTSTAEIETETARDAARAAPLAVDLDGTLLRTDVLAESVALGVCRRPLSVLAALPSLLKGRSAFKTRMAEIAPLNVDRLPVREPLLQFLQAQKRLGRPLYLVTAGERGIAERMAQRIGLFDGVYASSEGVNLKGRRKLELLNKLFPDGFAYAGDSAADLPIWRDAQSVVICGASPSVARQAQRLGRPVESEIDTGTPSFRTWRKSLRLHQWSKNALVFAPLLLSGKFSDPAALLTSILGFVVMGVAASATYLINDMADLESDRVHRTKRSRPLASGDLPVAQGLLAAPLMLVLALASAILLSPMFAVALVAYLFLTLSYSLRLKRVALLDVIVLAGLYTLRLIAGTLLTGAAFSPWLLTFSMFFFFSMSLAKRHVEVSSATSAPNELLAGRGYKPSDAPLTLTLGVATSAAAMLVIVQYLMAEAFPSHVYAIPAALWATPILLGLWICRIWLLAHRGELDDDPVAFAVRDRVSLGLGAVLGVFFAVALL